VKNVEKNNLTLIGVIGIMDVLRSEVPGAVETCKEAGVIVRMVTGDNIVTAKAIARQCNILNDQEMEDEQCSVMGPVFYEDMGGLICTTCKKSCPVDCLCED
jgi:Ca2+ transporting ATPase